MRCAELLCSRAAARLHTRACTHAYLREQLQTQAGLAGGNSTPAGCEGRATNRKAVCDHPWLRTIVFCLLRQHHLRVALGAQGPRLQQRLRKVDTPLVHIQASCDLQ